MNVEFTTEDGENGRYTGVGYFQQDVGEVVFFNDNDLGFVRTDAFVTYAGPGHTSNVPAANEESMEAMMADLRRKEQTVDGMLIVDSSAHSKQESSGDRRTEWGLQRRGSKPLTVDREHEAVTPFFFLKRSEETRPWLTHHSIPKNRRTTQTSENRSHSPSKKKRPKQKKQCWEQWMTPSGANAEYLHFPGDRFTAGGAIEPREETERKERGD